MTNKILTVCQNNRRAKKNILFVFLNLRIITTVEALKSRIHVSRLKWRNTTLLLLLYRYEYNYCTIIVVN